MDRALHRGRRARRIASIEPLAAVAIGTGPLPADRAAC